MAESSRQQKIFDGANLRIWIVASDRHGRSLPYSNRSSSNLIARAPIDWKLLKKPVTIAEPGSGSRNARILRHDGVSIVAVPHEFGVELAVAVGSSIAASAIIALVKHYWKRWKATKTSRPSELSTLRIQVETGRRKKGKRIKTFELTGDLSSPEVQALVKEGIAAVEK